MKDASRDELVIDQKAIVLKNGNIQINDLQYSIDETKILKNINLNLLSGQKLGIVGSVGSGKSSILKNIIGYIGIAAAADFTKHLMWNTFSKKTKQIIRSGKIYKQKNSYDSFYPIGKSLIYGGNKHLILEKKINCNFPLRFFHGLKDDVVPIKYSYLLSKTLIAKDSLIMLQNEGDHSLSSKKDLKRIGGELISLIKNLS